MLHSFQPAPNNEDFGALVPYPSALLSITSLYLCTPFLLRLSFLVWARRERETSLVLLPAPDSVTNHKPRIIRDLGSLTDSTVLNLTFKTLI